MSHTSRLLSRTVAPASEPVTLKEAKLYLRVDGNSEDALISDLIVAARMDAEQWMRRSLITQSLKLVCEDYCDAVTLPMGPVINITSVSAISQDGESVTLDPAIYYLNAGRTALMFSAINTGFKLEIVYTAGYGDASAGPKPIKIGMLAHIAAMYDNRGDILNGKLPAHSYSLYTPFREIYL